MTKKSQPIAVYRGGLPLMEIAVRHDGVLFERNIRILQNGWGPWVEIKQSMDPANLPKRAVKYRNGNDTLRRLETVPRCFVPDKATEKETP